MSTEAATMANAMRIPFSAAVVVVVVYLAVPARAYHAIETDGRGHPKGVVASLTDVSVQVIVIGGVCWLMRRHRRNSGKPSA